nr:MAG TPA: hypothetical protein [Caudoviricetes sp.]
MRAFRVSSPSRTCNKVGPKCDNACRRISVDT